MDKTKIILVRHGQSLANAEARLIGHCNMGLTELGQEQALKTAIALKDEKIDLIYSSDLIRAHDTAIPHSEIHNIPIVDSVLLREIHLGDWESRLVEELKRDYYEEYTVGWKENFGTFAFPNGESVLGASKRFHSAVLDIAKQNVGKNILITAHAAVIRGFWCLINGIQPQDMKKAFPFPDNASYSVAEFDGEKISPLRYSCSEHL